MMVIIPVDKNTKENTMYIKDYKKSKINMIHYINGKPHKDIQMNKAKLHALPAYRANQMKRELKDVATRFVIVLTVGAILTAVYLIKN